MTPVELLKLNVNDHVEKKQGLTYLSWAWAWAEALKADPAATFEVRMNEGLPYAVIEDTAMVFVTVTMFGKPLTCFLPVMNGANKPITFSGREVQTRNGPVIEKIDSFNVNTALMRCLTKCLAFHGLGLYIYAGEDLPEEEEPTPAPVKKAAPAPRAPAPKPVQPTEWDNSDASRTLFADGLIEYAKTCTDKAGLNSYWRSNQLQIDSLKTSHPDLYQKVLNHFTTLRATFESNT